MEIIINESQLRKLVNEQTESGGVWDYVFGDSIAVGLSVRAGEKYSKEMATKLGWSKEGANPQEIVGKIKEFIKDKDLTNKKVLVSSGYSNGQDLGNIRNEIDALKGAGANVYLLGVSNTFPKKGEHNVTLEKIANEKGVTFLGGFDAPGDNVHPSYGTLYSAISGGSSKSKTKIDKDLSKKVIAGKNLVAPMKYGSRGDEVKQVQQMLVNNKYPLPKYGVDGKFGRETEHALKLFQKVNGLPVTGSIVDADKEAWAKLVADGGVIRTNPKKFQTSSTSSSSGPKAKSNETASISDDLIVEIINGTISAGGSKNYTDLFLDSQNDTAVGILHFTKRGLKKLYQAMDTKKYFGKSENEMEASIKTYSGDEMKDSSWKKGMLSFLNSSESESIQNKAASRKFKNGLALPIQRGGWTTPREYAVGMFFLNSYPACLKPAGLKYGWDAEKMLNSYCSGECSGVSACRSRCNHINKSYPISASSGGYVYKGC
jgi:peptidoglycan hydrolase-like protein with peptidoglycan-binding domain